MNILIVTTSYPRNSNDMSGIFIKRLAVAMKQSCEKITVIAPGYANVEKKQYDIDNGINVIRFPYAPKPLMQIAYGTGGIPENLKSNPYLYALVPFFLISLIFHIIKFSKYCDVIHANWLFTGLCALPAAKIRKKPLIITLRGSDFKKKESKLFIFLSKFVDTITTVNEQWATDLTKKLHCKVFYTPNGVAIPEQQKDDSIIDFDSKTVKVLYVGTLSFTKGSDILAKVIAIAHKIPEIKFIVAGPGTPEKFGLDVLPNVILEGFVPPEQVFKLYESTDIFILLSRHEGRPNTLLEAMASGLPCIATKLPGVCEVINKECGIIVDIDNPLQMVEAISELAKNPEKRKQMGINAKKRIKELSLDWNSSASNYLKIFQEAICVRNSGHS
ncbi:MAG: glycosyltransferase family 4 protein [Desulfamplus sp.]|nr:glycosyltransferase family 4 protein [Desulfamplus sp.]